MNLKSTCNYRLLIKQIERSNSKTRTVHVKQGVALTVRNRTGPLYSVGRLTVHAPSGRPARRQCYRRQQTTDASEQNNTGPLGGTVTMLSRLSNEQWRDEGDGLGGLNLQCPPLMKNWDGVSTTGHPCDDIIASWFWTKLAEFRKYMGGARGEAWAQLPPVPLPLPPGEMLVFVKCPLVDILSTHSLTAISLPISAAIGAQ